jgi:pimeloyl-ACP methyl ester carboxylesterase
MNALLLTLAIIVTGALLLVVALVGGVWWHQERIAYQPPAESPTPPADVSRIEYVADDGQRLYGYVIDPAATAAGLLVAFHGNADLATWQIPWAREVARRTGWAVLLAEYRGYGGLTGAPTYAAVQQDARAAWRAAQDIARARLASPAPTFALFGHSLGSAVAVELAAEIRATQPRAITAVLLQSPFTTAREMARIVSARPVQVLWKLISRVHYDSRSRLDEIDAPISISHGERDWLVPVAMGRELFARSRTPGGLLIVRDAGHNDVAYVGGDAYWRWMSGALTARERDPSVSESESKCRTGTPG